MTPERYRKIKDIFNEACRRSATDRSAFLDVVCASDSQLRTDVEALLSQDQDTADFLEKPALGAHGRLEAHLVESDAFTASLDLGDPDHIGPYQIISVLGEGGMGLVYRALQHNPNREVALKVMRRASVSPQVRRRFEQEAQLLGRLLHPGIAQVYEAGVASSPRGEMRYFAMELVDGRPLNEYAAAHRLTTRQRVALLAKVCDAVHHAHQKGIIHRDLKPSNILVVEDRGAASLSAGTGAIGQPKVLDFGVARVMGDEFETLTRHTLAGQLIGTISYMSPEQVTGDIDIDIRADVFALGSIGFELLTGRLPYDLADRPLAECARVIRDEEPRRLASIDKSLRGDLDAIIGKCLEKKRERRYQSVADLGADLRRVLEYRPVTARQPSVVYRCHTFVKRRPAMVLAMILVVATPPLAVYAYQAWRIEAQKRHTNRDYTLELSSGALESSGDHDIPRVSPEKLSRIAAWAQDELTDDAAAQANLLHLVGLNYLNLRMLPEAKTSLNEALRLRRSAFPGPSPEVAESLHSLARSEYFLNDFQNARFLYEESLVMAQATRGPDHEHIANTMQHLGVCLHKLRQDADAEALLKGSLAMRERLAGSGAPSHAVVQASHALAYFYTDLNRYGEAEPLFAKGLAQLQDSPRHDELPVAATMINYGDCLKHLGRMVDAESLTRQALAIRERDLPGGHPLIARARLKLADLLLRPEDPLALLEAESLCHEAIHSSEHSTSGEVDALQVCRAKTILGECLGLMGRDAEAQAELAEAKRAIESARAQDDPETRATREKLDRLMRVPTDSAE